MHRYLPFPEISPEIFSVSVFGIELALRWYALAYVAGLVLGLVVVNWLIRRPELWLADKAPMSKGQPDDLLTYMVIGVVLGGRLGFVLFYQPGYYLSNPAEILALWQGGMSFHGGFIGVIVGIILFAWRNGLPVLSVGDAVAVVSPIGLFFGRIANFINGELWGRPTTQPWGVLFPSLEAQTCPDWWTEVCARHPSQLYEAALEGALLLAVMAWLLFRRKALKVPGLLTGVFFIGYGLGRSLVENFRQGDLQFTSLDNPWGQVIRFGTGPDALGLTMGQVLSLPMIAIGAAFLVYAFRQHDRA